MKRMVSNGGKRNICGCGQESASGICKTTRSGDEEREMVLLQPREDTRPFHLFQVGGGGGINFYHKEAMHPQ